MANLIITVESVLAPELPARLPIGIAGESLIRGQLVYLKSDGRWWKTTATTAEESGNGLGPTNIRIAMSDCSINQSVILLDPGQRYTVGATLTLGTLYVLSATSGLICPNTDLVTTNYFTPLGYPYNSLKLNFNPDATGQQIP